MSQQMPSEISLMEVDCLKFENLMLHQQVLELQRELLWRDIERRYGAVGYRLDMARRVLVAPAPVKEQS